MVGSVAPAGEYGRFPSYVSCGNTALTQSMSVGS